MFLIKRLNQITDVQKPPLKKGRLYSISVIHFIPPALSGLFERLHTSLYAAFVSVAHLPYSFPYRHKPNPCRFRTVPSPGLPWVTVSQGKARRADAKKRTERPFCPLAILAGEAFRCPEGLPRIQSRISISLPQQKGTTSPAFTWTVLLQVTQYTSVS